MLSAIEAAGIDAAPIAARLDDPDVVAALEANTTEAAERGVFGAPTTFVGDEVFFGNEPLEVVRECLSAKEMA